MVLFLHRRARVPRGGERPCPRLAGASDSGALLSEWVQRRCPASARTRGWDPGVGPAAGGPGGARPLALLPPVGLRTGPGRRVKWDKGAAPRGAESRPARTQVLSQLLAQHSLGRRNTFPRPTRGQGGLTSHRRRNDSPPRGLGLRELAKLSGVNRAGAGMRE